jgi:hypothetical protein
MRIDYENPEVVARQSIAPNAGCDIDGVFYDMRNCVHLLNEQADRIEELQAKLAKALDGLHEAESAPEPDHHVPQFRYVMDIIGAALAELKGKDQG